MPSNPLTDLDATLKQLIRLRVAAYGNNACVCGWTSSAMSSMMNTASHFHDYDVKIQYSHGDTTRWCISSSINSVVCHSHGKMMYCSWISQQRGHYLHRLAVTVIQYSQGSSFDQVLCRCKHTIHTNHDHDHN